MKKRKAFLYGFLMLAMITLLSGMVQSNNRVAETTPIYALDNSPPAMLPTFDLNLDITSPAVTWLCTSMPGVQDQISANICLRAIDADVLSTNYIINYTILNRNQSNDYYTIWTSRVYPDIGFRLSSTMINTYNVNPRYKTVANYTTGVNTRLDIGETYLT